MKIFVLERSNKMKDIVRLVHRGEYIYININCIECIFRDEACNDSVIQLSSGKTFEVEDKLPHEVYDMIMDSYGRQNKNPKKYKKKSIKIKK